MSVEDKLHEFEGQGAETLGYSIASEVQPLDQNPVKHEYLWMNLATLNRLGPFILCNQ